MLDAVTNRAALAKRAPVLGTCHLDSSPRVFSLAFYGDYVINLRKDKDP